MLGGGKSVGTGNVWCFGGRAAGWCRWGGCRPREEMLTTHIPVPILPLEWFPQPASNAVAAALSALAAIQHHRKGGNSSQFMALLHNMPQQAA